MSALASHPRSAIVSFMGTRDAATAAEEMARTLLANYSQPEALDAALAVVREVSRRGAVNAVLTYAQNKPKPVRRGHPVQVLVATVCHYYGVSTDEVRSHRRHPPFVRARKVIWLLMRERFQMTLCDIAGEFRRHHTTILAGLERVQLEHADFTADLAEVTKRLDAFECAAEVAA
jgi:chromosomal replication initiation ATPase DnaA